MELLLLEINAARTFAPIKYAAQITACAGHTRRLSAPVEGNNNMESYNRSTRIFVIAITLVVSLGVIAAAYALAHTVNRQEDQPVPLNCSSIDNLQTDQDRIYFYVDGELYCYDEEGGIVWQHTLGEGADYRVYDYGVAAWQGSKLYLIGRDGSMLFSSSMTSDIRSCAMCANYAAVETTVNGANTLQVIEYNGKVIDTVDMSALTLLDYGFFSDSNMMWVMTLNTEGTVPLTQVNTYQPARFQTGSIPDSSQVIYKVVLQNNELVLVGTNTINQYSYTSKKTSSAEKLVYGWYYMDSSVSGKSPAYLFAPARQLQDCISIKDMRVISGQSDYTVHFQLPCMSIYAGEDAAYAISNQYAFKNVYGSSETLAYALPLYVDQVVAFTGDGAAVVVSDQRVYIIKLP